MKKKIALLTFAVFALTVPQPAVGVTTDETTGECPDILDTPFNDSASFSEAYNCDKQNLKSLAVKEVKKAGMDSANNIEYLGNQLKQSGVPIAENVGEWLIEQATSAKDRVRRISASSV